MNAAGEPLDVLKGMLNDDDFIGCLRYIDCQHTDKPRQGHAARPKDEIVRLSQKPVTGFKGRALESIEASDGLHDYRLFCNFLGLFGSNGALPLHFTEYADQRARHHRDPTFAAFVDLFNHRMLSLFYRACVEFEPAINLDRTHDNMLEDMLAAMGGYSVSASRQRDSVPDNFKRFNAVWMGRQCKSPDGIKALLTQYFGIQARIDEFTGGWLTLPDNARTVLGKSSNSTALGVSTYLGKRAWSISHKFRVILGPLPWEDYLSFKPGGDRATTLLELIKNYVADEWDWDVEFVIDKVKGCQLNRGAALGFNSVLGLKQNPSLRMRHIRFNKRVLIEKRSMPAMSHSHS